MVSSNAFFFFFFKSVYFEVNWIEEAKNLQTQEAQQQFMTGRTGGRSGGGDVSEHQRKPSSAKWFFPFWALVSPSFVILFHVQKITTKILGDC